MATSPVHSSGHDSLLKYSKITLNTALTTAPVMPSLSDNLLQRVVFDYDFSRERTYLEITETKIAAIRKARSKAPANEQENSDAELSTKLSLASSMSSTGRPDSTSTKPRSTSEEDVAAAISASLREY
ncbi:hypothetical protein CCR75_002536 [Bremia lactucae]|uniref:Uncharacterized protein n=1 Tax=Bremia lactucae TaxID=4779 RepID=A0A976FN50_BRELC|nr:hypothetical protein CCR75_002536 [Bremia lactucae]